LYVSGNPRVRIGDYLLASHVGIETRNKAPPSSIYCAEDKFNRQPNRSWIMLTKSKIALAAVALLSLAGAPAASASDNSSGDYHGGFVMPGSMDGVNPAYHPDFFGNHAKGSRAYGYAGGRGAYASTKRSRAFDHSNGRNAYGSANDGRTAGYNGVFVNGNFIPRGTSPAQVPAYREEY
jgi:hypothetical protein